MSEQFELDLGVASALTPRYPRYMKVYEIDPLVCEKCGGRMKIKSFVTNPHEVAKILAHHNIPSYRAPPPIPKPAPEVEQYIR